MISQRTKGFTLIELLVVIAIIGILITLVASAITRAKTKAMIKRCLGNTREMSDALDVYIESLVRVPRYGGMMDWAAIVCQKVGLVPEMLNCPANAAANNNNGNDLTARGKYDPSSNDIYTPNIAGIPGVHCSYDGRKLGAVNPGVMLDPPSGESHTILVAEHEQYHNGTRVVLFRAGHSIYFTEWRDNSWDGSGQTDPYDLRDLTGNWRGN